MPEPLPWDGWLRRYALSRAGAIHALYTVADILCLNGLISVAAMMGGVGGGIMDTAPGCCGAGHWCSAALSQLLLGTAPPLGHSLHAEMVRPLRSYRISHQLPFFLSHWLISPTVAVQPPKCEIWECQ